MDTGETKSVTLYSIREENGDSYSMTATYTGTELIMFSHDFSQFHKAFFGDDEYEGYRIFDSENVDKLCALFDTTDILSALTEYFKGEMKDTEFFDLCKENSISFKYHVR